MHRAQRSGTDQAGRLAVLALAAALIGAMLARRSSRRPTGREPNRHTEIAQLNDSPPRRYYTGPNLERAVAIEDLRARTHRRLPRFALEYLEGGAEDEASLARERVAFAEWRFTPRQLVDVSHRSLATEILGRPAPAPLIISPTGLNGVFRRHADTELAKGAAAVGVPFVQGTMSNDRLEDVARAAPGLRHWWQLYVFGPDEVWQDLIRRADAAGCEALVLTTNAQIFGNREWQTRTQATPTRLTVGAAIDAALHPVWFAETLGPAGMPRFANLLDYIPKKDHGLFESADWVREHQPKSLAWDTVAEIRARWKKPFFLKGILNVGDVRRAVDAGVDGVVLGTHAGRQLDWSVSALDLLPEARAAADGRIALHISGGIRRGTDLLKALALGAEALWVGHAPLYGVAAGGAAGVERALDILMKEADDAMGLLGVASLDELTPDLLRRQAPRFAPMAGPGPLARPPAPGAVKRGRIPSPLAQEGVAAGDG